MGRASRVAIIAGMTLVATPLSAQLIGVRMIYPRAALLARKEGAVGFKVQLNTHGLVDECEVTKSSGDRDLDRETCLQLSRTGLFQVPRDAAGHPKRSTYEGRLRWVLPSTSSSTPPAAPR